MMGYSWKCHEGKDPTHRGKPFEFVDDPWPMDVLNVVSLYFECVLCSDDELGEEDREMLLYKHPWVIAEQARIDLENE
ncbi:MAG: hypothetical protein M1814_000942 [Vezdaea aestivalis]|nr:MAG: hypothetical protein M1814_000942 [Vezdaea aestivalis]